MHFFSDDGMDFAARCLLSGVRDGAAEVGELLTAFDAITDGDPDSWLDEFSRLGRRLAADGDDAANEGHRKTAWGCSLRAANALFGGAWWAPATAHADDVASLWAEHRAAWDAAVSRWPSPAESVKIPTPVGDLPGYRFASTAAADRGTVVMIQGLDTPLSDA